MGHVLRAFGIAALLAAVSAPFTVQAVSPDQAREPARKSVANGLYLSGYSASFASGYSTVTITVPALNNDSYTRTTGTLRIEYWATDTPPAARGQSFASGYRLARFPTPSGGSGSVHCGDGVNYLADGTWTLTRSQ